jgi:hypothetical protein
MPLGSDERAHKTPCRLIPVDKQSSVHAADLSNDHCGALEMVQSLICDDEIKGTRTEGQTSEITAHSLWTSCQAKLRRIKVKRAQ